MWTQTLTQLSVWALEYVAALDTVLIVPQHKDRGMCVCVCAREREQESACMTTHITMVWWRKIRSKAVAVFKAPHVAKQRNMLLLYYRFDYKTRNVTRLLLNPATGKNTVITNSLIFYSSDPVVEDRRFIRQWANDSIVSWWFHALVTAAGSAWRRPSSDLSSGLHSGAVLLTGLQPFITMFHYCTKSR